MLIILLVAQPIIPEWEIPKLEFPYFTPYYVQIKRDSFLGSGFIGNPYGGCIYLRKGIRNSELEVKGEYEYLNDWYRGGVLRTNEKIRVLLKHFYITPSFSYTLLKPDTSITIMDSELNLFYFFTPFTMGFKTKFLQAGKHKFKNYLLNVFYFKKGYSFLSEFAIKNDFNVFSFSTSFLRRNINFVTNVKLFNKTPLFSAIGFFNGGSYSLSISGGKEREISPIDSLYEEIIVFQEDPKNTWVNDNLYAKLILTAIKNLKLSIMIAKSKMPIIDEYEGLPYLVEKEFLHKNFSWTCSFSKGNFKNIFFLQYNWCSSPSWYPKWDVVNELISKFGNLNIHFFIRYLGERETSLKKRNSVVPLNLRIEYRLKKVGIDLELLNLSNKSYEVWPGLKSKGRIWKLIFSIHFL